MKYQKFIRHLHRHHCVMKRQGGNHEVWLNLDNEKVQHVPRHAEVSPVMVRKICKLMDIPVPKEK